MEPRLFIASLALIVIYMTVCFFVAKWRGRFDTVDLAWGGGFVLVAWFIAWQEPYLRTMLVAAMITVWAVRLTWYLGKRSLRSKEDSRYAEMIKPWKRPWLHGYFSIFLLQGVLIWLVAAPVIFNANRVVPELKFLFTLGYVIWVVGFYIESRADRQLEEFKAEPKNKGKVLDTGLWKYSRHPNYFGELVQWWGIGIIACQTELGWFGLVGPLLLTVWVAFVSGVPTVEARREKDKDYKAYKKRTSMLFPLPNKK